MSGRTPKRFSPFTQAVYAFVAEIPRGEVMTYKEVAAAVGRPRAFRAVGTILSKNFDPNVPCHRVIRSDGKMGDYNRGGAERKRKRLEEEGALKEA